ncbi:homoserine O-acetyltransferase [Halolamina sp. CBA1230]|uniref:homoserine O-acetyltransferase MetX n=1 Tax=Halolamina sp. CBA1230 TaxID=1853690 RepID=UPI0009A24133|nr:homoserine O-acetyltransferase [Halolamina sp. CBA1230]QKY19418.1 homoserine O-acetyltransferase [Halolamina sp. CBA1230]
MTGTNGATPTHAADTRSVGAFEFERGGSVPDLELAYETYGEYDPDGGPNGEGNAVLVCHALTGSQHVASAPDGDGGDTPETAGQARAWWDDVVGPEQAIDTTEFFVVCVNVPGSCYGSTGPASAHPDGGVWGSSFPAVTVADWTRAQRRLLDEIGVDRLHAVVGGSVGGMNVLDWVRQFPADLDRAIPVAAAPQLDAQLLGLNAVARRAIRGDPAWHEGEYAAEGTHPDRGLALARQLGHLSYLSKASMDRKFDRGESEHDVESPFPADPAAESFPEREVETYLDHQATTFVDRFDANSYLYLTRAMDEFDLSSGYDSDADALSGFDGETLVLSFTGDWHFPAEAGGTLADAFAATDTPVTHHVVDSDHGHDAFLVEPERVGPPIRDFLAAGVDGDAVEHTDCADADTASQRPPTPGTPCSGFMG